MPFGGDPAAQGSTEALHRAARGKAASLNQHVLGYGRLAEAEAAEVSPN